MRFAQSGENHLNLAGQAQGVTVGRKNSSVRRKLEQILTPESAHLLRIKYEPGY